MQTHYIDPGSPGQNAYGESFNDQLRHECQNPGIMEPAPV
ncbi:MAG: transposase [Deltaproteobacteria bacterium]|nr:transposase [Deltaproteobacteria bacterium]